MKTNIESKLMTSAEFRSIRLAYGLTLEELSEGSGVPATALRWQENHGQVGLTACDTLIVLVRKITDHMIEIEEKIGDYQREHGTPYQLSVPRDQRKQHQPSVRTQQIIAGHIALQCGPTLVVMHWED